MAEQNQILIDVLKQISTRSGLENAENVKIFRSIASSLYKQQESLQTIQKTLNLQSRNSFANTFSSVFAKPLEKIVKAIESTKQKPYQVLTQTSTTSTKQQMPVKVEEASTKTEEQKQNTKLQQLEQIQPVSIESFGENSLESLNKSLLDVLPRAIKEGLQDFAKDLNKTLKNLAKAVEEQEGSGAGGGILDALGLSSLFGGGKVKSGKPPKDGASGKPSVKGGPRRAGFGLAGLLTGAALATGASWAAGKLLGKDEDFEKIDPEELKGYTERSKEFGNTERLDLAKAQIQAQKKDVGIEGVQTAVGYTGFLAGQKIAPKLVASAKATRVWRVFMVYIKRKAPSIFAKIGTKLAAAAGLAAIPAVGWIGAAINIGFTIWTAYDLYQLWKEFSALSDIEKQYFADEANSKPIPDKELPTIKEETSTTPEATPTPVPAPTPATSSTVSEANPSLATDTKTGSKPKTRADAATSQKTTASPPINVDRNLPAVKTWYGAEQLEQKRLELKAAELEIPMAKGGVVTKPTKALVGEAGPEAVIPLNQFDLTSLKNNSFAKAETILEKIANNTGSTNQGLSNLINGFNNLAKALKESGTISQAPVVVNQVEQQQAKFAGIAQYTASMSSPARSYNAGFADVMKPVRV